MKKANWIFLSLLFFTFSHSYSDNFYDHFSNSRCEPQRVDFSINDALPLIDTGRIVPELPPSGEKLRLLIDSDAANEIDDLYAIALALNAPDRFNIVGFVATHFAGHGPEGIEASYSLILELLEKAGVSGKYTVKRSAHPMQYIDYPSEGEGVDFIIEQARKATQDDPLWVVCLGAATNIASAILKDPEIIPRIRVVFHSRSSQTWPERSVQYNVTGDILAARTLLKSKVPLVWFDTGTNLRISFEETEKHLASTGSLGEFIHDFRKKRANWMTDQKGFFDLGDIAFLIKPELCSLEIINAPTMNQNMYFNQKKINGKMMRVYEIKNEETWQLLFEKMGKYSNIIRKK
ncbi:MAG TPA: nucleoside hydrolase [Bacteroidales bacterium]|nr:nucleoside hydrolase [Bacteroidales bacterium]